ncbi:unnamed protein product, partial [Lampetra fluviatilis]
AGRGSSSSVLSPSAGVAPPPTPPPAPPPAPPGDDEEVDVLAAPRWSPPHRARPGSAFAGSGDADSQRPRGALSLTGLVAPTSDVEGIGGEAWGAREEEWGAREEEWGARGALSVDPGRLFHSAPLQRIVGGWDRAAVSSTAFEAAPDPGLSLSTIESQGTSEASLRAPAGAPSRRPRVPRDDEKLRRLREVVSRQRAERGGTGTGEPRHGEERAALPVFSEPPLLLAAKVRKVASAPPAPVYRGEWRWFSQAECSVRAPDGSVYREHEFRALARDPAQRHRFSLLLPSGSEGKAPARSPERAGTAAAPPPARRTPVRKVQAARGGSGTGAAGDAPPPTAPGKAELQWEDHKSLRDPPALTSTKHLPHSKQRGLALRVTDERRDRTRRPAINSSANAGPESTPPRGSSAASWGAVGGARGGGASLAASSVGIEPASPRPPACRARPLASRHRRATLAPDRGENVGVARLPRVEPTGPAAPGGGRGGSAA